MCLLSTTNIPTIANEDIVVYKILYKTDNSSPIRDFLYHKGLNIAEGPEAIIKRKENAFEISVGFLHAYVNYNQVSYYFSSFYLSTRQKYHIVQMIIPKGTKYFIGVNNDICAKQLLWPENT